MSQYGVIYRSQWLMQDDTRMITVNIYDTEVLIDDSDTPLVIPIKGSGQPLVISTVNNDKKKYGIRAKQAKIEFLSDDTVNAYTFADAKDFRWYVEVKNDLGDKIFLGFLVLNEITRPFLPNKQVITLTASDNLGLLKERKLTAADGSNPTGKARIASYISWCLIKTGMELEIKVSNNIKAGSGSLTGIPVQFISPHEIRIPDTYEYFLYVGQQFTVSGSVSNNSTFSISSFTSSAGTTYITVEETITSPEFPTSVTLTDELSGHIYDQVYLDAKTFESQIGECENSYSVLEKILDKDCFLTQYKGAWWIMRPDDFDDNDVYIATFLSDGSFAEYDSPTTYNKNIGAGEDIIWINATQMVEYDRPFKFAKHTFKYEYPNEIPCNSDFSRGDFIANISSTEKSYQLSCWTLREGVPGFYGTVDGTTATIHRKFNENDYEIEKYVVLTPRTTFETSSINDVTYIESEAIPIEEKDKFNATIEWRLNLGIATGGNASARLMRFVLNGNDGSWWILGYDSNGDEAWFNTLNWTVFTAEGNVNLDFDLMNEEEWDTQTWNAPPAPVTGNLYVWLNQFNQLNSSDDNKEIWYSSFSFTYLPYINGTYQKYSGQSSKVERSETGFSANLDEDVSISDSPKPILKGGLFDENGVIVERFYNSLPFALGSPPNGDYFHPFEYIRVFSTYNQNKKGIRIFSGTVRWSGADWPDLIHKYYLTETDYDSSHRKFMLLSFDQDWKTGQMSATVSQTHHDDGKDYNDPFEFKYII